MAGLLVWLLAFFFILALLCVIGYQIILLVDLEFDYINPYDSAARINHVILPEFIIQGVFASSFLYLDTGLCFWCLSLAYITTLDCKYITKQYLVDVTEIYNNLRWEKQRRYYKVGYLVMLFVLSVFWLIWSITEMEDD